jgi:hypothetical protein
VLMLSCFLAASCTSTRLPKPRILTTDMDAVAVADCVRRGAAEAGWTVSSEVPFHATYQEGPHLLTLVIGVEGGVATTRYLESENLNYSRLGSGEQWIHRRAVQWWRALDARIRLSCTLPPSQYVLVQSDVAPARHPVAEPEVAKSGRYEQLRGHTSRIGVLTQRCLNTSVGGDARPSAGHESSVKDPARDELLGTDCGVEMAVVERVLTENAYTVHSWREFAANSTALDTARRHGVELLLQVNSLELSPSKVGLSRRNRWYQSNARGEAVALLDEDTSGVVLSANDIAQLNHMIASAAASSEQRWDVRTDVSIVDVATGETIWLYRATDVFVPDDGASRQSGLFVGEQPRIAGRVHGARQWTQVPIPQAAGQLGATTARLDPGGTTFGDDTRGHGVVRDAALRHGIQKAIGCFQKGECSDPTR